MVSGVGNEVTQIVIALVAVLPSTLAVYFSYKIHRAIRTPSGERIGELTERTNELAIVNTTMTQEIHKTVNDRRDQLAEEE